MKKWRLVVAILLAGCSKQPQANVVVRLSNGGKSLQISGFDKAVLDDIGRDSSNEAWQVLLPIYKMPADTEMKDFQNAQP
ncbi:MAG: hypothetical protein JST19_23195, partial [Bacteroidetes bacterium]|nr:hypothetical protein [Bacteroidota bacterium]